MNGIPNSLHCKEWAVILDKLVDKQMDLLRLLDYHFPITAPDDERHVTAKKKLFKEPILETVTNLKALKELLRKEES